MGEISVLPQIHVSLFPNVMVLEAGSLEGWSWD